MNETNKLRLRLQTLWKHNIRQKATLILKAQSLSKKDKNNSMLWTQYGYFLRL